MRACVSGLCLDQWRALHHAISHCYDHISPGDLLPLLLENGFLGHTHKPAVYIFSSVRYCRTVGVEVARKLVAFDHAVPLTYTQAEGCQKSWWPLAILVYDRWTK